jgi:branched-chain amino acid aminotransferase
MAARIAFLNGSFIPEETASISINDRGFIFADAAFDVARTFWHEPYQLDEHIDRLMLSLQYLGIDMRMSPADVKAIACEVVQRNVGLLGPDDEYWITIRATRGLSQSPFSVQYDAGPSPTVLVYTPPVPFESFATLYQSGLALPLFLDLRGNVTEALGSNFFLVRRGELWTSTENSVLAGVTRATILDIGRQSGFGVHEADLTPYDVYTAEEAFLTATSFCRPAGGGRQRQDASTDSGPADEPSH